MTKTEKPIDWHKKFNNTKPPKTVVTHVAFAGIKAGTTMLIGDPPMIANYMRAIPSGQTKTIEVMRNELARKNKAQVMCPVSTAIFARITAEAALTDIRSGKAATEVTPFWRVIGPETKLANRLSCTSDEIRFWLQFEANQ